MVGKGKRIKGGKRGYTSFEDLSGYFSDNHRKDQRSGKRNAKKLR
jgi:hypothetical protein